MNEAIKYLNTSLSILIITKHIQKAHKEKSWHVDWPENEWNTFVSHWIDVRHEHSFHNGTLKFSKITYIHEEHWDEKRT